MSAMVVIMVSVKIQTRLIETGLHLARSPVSSWRLSNQFLFLWLPKCWTPVSTDLDSCIDHHTILLMLFFPLSRQLKQVFQSSSIIFIQFGMYLIVSSAKKNSLWLGNEQKRLVRLPYPFSEGLGMVYWTLLKLSDFTQVFISIFLLIRLFYNSLRMVKKKKDSNAMIVVQSNGNILPI